MPENRRKGLLIVNTGNGKGKTTAALGTILRAWGRGMRPCVIQFMKSGKGQWGEVKAARRLDIEWHSLGDGFTWTSKDMDETIARAQHAWAIAQEKITSNGYDMILLDEFTYPLQFGWLNTDEVLAWLKEYKPSNLHIIITGRGAPAELIAMADMVTEMSVVRHPYDQGVSAQPGIEF